MVFVESKHILPKDMTYAAEEYSFARVAPPTQGTWRSNDYVSAVRLVDALFVLWSG